MLGFKRKRITLLVMRLADMHLFHPEMTTLSCSRCAHLVGVYPSGQAVMRKHGDRVDLVCAVCQPPTGAFVPAPGALAEAGQSIRTSRTSRKN